MADVKKIATRESYGNTLKELAAEGHEDLVVLDVKFSCNLCLRIAARDHAKHDFVFRVLYTPYLQHQ